MYGLSLSNINAPTSSSNFSYAYLQAPHTKNNKKAGLTKRISLLLRMSVLSFLYIASESREVRKKKNESRKKVTVFQVKLFEKSTK